MTDSLALAGVTGGAGTTRLSVEFAATMARAGHSVAVLDAAFATQGLATYVPGPIDRDLTSVLVDEAALGDARFDVWRDLDGDVALYPSYAPFERVARAKSPDATRRFERCIERTVAEFDCTILDVPPVADNPAVAAITTAARRALVVPANRRGRDLLPRMKGRLVDVGCHADAVVANCLADEDAEALPEADYVIPSLAEGGASPACIAPDASFAPAVAEAAGGLFDVRIDLEFPTDGLFS